MNENPANTEACKFVDGILYLKDIPELYPRRVINERLKDSGLSFNLSSIYARVYIHNGDGLDSYSYVGNDCGWICLRQGVKVKIKRRREDGEKGGDIDGGYQREREAYGI